MHWTDPTGLVWWEGEGVQCIQSESDMWYSMRSGLSTVSCCCIWRGTPKDCVCALDLQLYSLLPAGSFLWRVILYQAILPALLPQTSLRWLQALLHPTFLPQGVQKCFSKWTELCLYGTSPLDQIRYKWALSLSIRLSSSSYNEVQWPLFFFTFLLSVQMLAEVPAAVNSIAFNHNGHLIVAGCSDGALRLFGLCSNLSSSQNVHNYISDYVSLALVLVT